MASVRLNRIRREDTIKDPSDNDVLDEISLDTSWLDSDTVNDSIELLDDMKAPDNLDVQMPSKTVDGNRNRFVYDGKEDDSMREDYFPDLALEEDASKEDVEEHQSTKKNSGINKLAIIIPAAILIVVAICLIAVRLTGLI